MPHTSFSTYRLLLWAAFPVIAVYTTTVALRYRCMHYMLQRYGYYMRSDENANIRPLWFHCASVGETNTALPLIRAWLEHHPDDYIVLTSNTVTASYLVKKQAISNVRHCYLPIDYPNNCRRFLTTLQPRCAFIMETELWLHLFTECRKATVPVFLLNARLSKRTLKHRHWLAGHYRKTLSAVEHIYSRSQIDADSYHMLGADRISVLGNLKYAARPLPCQKPLLEKAYILAASTHEGEELQIVQAWQEAGMPQLLVIVPRHPERGKEILQRLRQAGHDNVQLRSLKASLHSGTRVYIADTIGELPQWIAQAKLVFTGGSLVDAGGHNVLEPAAAGTPQITGPHTQNFSLEVQALEDEGGIKIVADKSALMQALQNYRKTPERYQIMASNAHRHWRTRQGILNEYLAAISQHAHAASPNVAAH